MKTGAAAALSMVAGTALAAIIATSTFDTGTEGWTAENDFTNFQWTATGGNPGGFIQAADQVLGNTWRFVAPNTFLGNQSAAYGGHLSYDIFLFPTTLPFFDAAEVLLTNSVAGLTLVWNAASNPVSGVWTHFDAGLTEVGWNVGSTAGPAATAAQMQLVLGNLTALRIRGEYINGPDTEGLDNVVLAAPEPGSMALLLAGLAAFARRRSH